MLIVRDQEHEAWMLKSCISPAKVKQKTVVPHCYALVDVVNLVINLLISQHLILNITFGFNWQKKTKQRTLIYATFSPVYFTGLWTCKSASRMSYKQIYSCFSTLWSGSIFSTVMSVGYSPVPFYAHTISCLADGFWPECCIVSL